MENQENLEALNIELNIVYRYLVKKGVSKKDAEDAVQEAACKYMEFLGSTSSSKIRSWLIRVALNYYYDQYRKNKRYIFNLEDESLESNTADLPEMVALKNERNKELYRLLNKLKPRDRELLLLKYESELSYVEISNLFGVHISSVKTNLFRARKKLVKLYEEVYNEGK